MLTHLAMLNRMVLDFLFPARCVACGREGSYICEGCMLSASYINPPFCPVCILPVEGKRRCDCHYWKSLDGLNSLFAFKGAIREAVLQFKYYNLRAIAPLLGGLMFNNLKSAHYKPDLLIAVPLHKKRLRERGFNQSELLAREICTLTGIYRSKSLVRKYNNPSQVNSKNAGQRRKNVSMAFSCTGSQVEGKNILLIDDVATTGATLDACASALKVCGAARVRGLTLAREI